MIKCLVLMLVLIVVYNNAFLYRLRRHYDPYYGYAYESMGWSRRRSSYTVEARRRTWKCIRRTKERLSVTAPTLLRTVGLTESDGGRRRGLGFTKILSWFSTLTTSWPRYTPPTPNTATTATYTSMNASANSPLATTKSDVHANDSVKNSTFTIGTIATNVAANSIKRNKVDVPEAVNGNVTLSTSKIEINAVGKSTDYTNATVEPSGDVTSYPDIARKSSKIFINATASQVNESSKVP